MEMKKKTCPICSKSLSYSGGVFSKHGYQIRWNQHTPSLCFGSYRSEDGLIEAYVEALERCLDQESKKFPNEWLSLSVMRSEHREDKEKYLAFRTYKQLMSDIAFFRKKTKDLLLKY